MKANAYLGFAIAAEEALTRSRVGSVQEAQNALLLEKWLHMAVEFEAQGL